MMGRSGVFQKGSVREKGNFGKEAMLKKVTVDNSAELSKDNKLSHLENKTNPSQV